MNMNPTISQHEFEQRRHTVRDELARRGLDGLVAFSGYQDREGHVAYLTNHRNSYPNTLTHLGRGHSAALISTSGKTALVAPLGYEAQAVGVMDHVFTGGSLVEEMAKALKALHLERCRLGIAGMDVIPAEYYLHLQKEFSQAAFENANNLLENMRLVKSPAEIDCLRAAAHAADAGLSAGLGTVHPGATGHEIELAARRAAYDAGAEFIVRVRVSIGKSIKLLQWPQISSSRLENGDLVFLDLIGFRNGYGFDCSRVAVAGSPTSQQAAFLAHLAEATDWMVNVIKPGEENRIYLAESRGSLITPAAHGIGLEIAETPIISAGTPFLARPGMVLCIEPEISSPQFGEGSVENMVLVTKSGVEVLNQLPAFR